MYIGIVGVAFPFQALAHMHPDMGAEQGAFVGKRDLGINGVIEIFFDAVFQAITDMSAQRIANIDLLADYLNLHSK